MKKTVVVCIFFLITSNLSSQNWTLTNDQRRAFLRYYSPIILKRAQEGVFNGTSQRGRDWLTNWYFDNQSVQNSYDKRAWQNHLLRDNRSNWKDNLSAYISNAGSGFSNWAIRPTLYTSLLEFVENDANGTARKCLILMYHPYQAMDLNNKIHDWESITIRINGVTGNPGSGEEISYVVITVHGDDAVLKYGDPSLNFEANPDGKHVLIWRAQWDYHPASDNREGQELQFVRDKSQLYGSDLVSAAISVYDPVHRPSPVTANFHYLFVCEGTQSASQRWNAQSINNCNALSLSSGKNPNESVPLRDAKKITYELQDIADIIPTMKYDYDWKDASDGVQEYYHMGDCVDPILNEDGTIVEVAANNGEQDYFPEARGDDRRGYVTKDWFSGKFGEPWHDDKTQHRYKPMKKISWTTQDVSTALPYYFSVNAQLNDQYDMATDWYLASKGGFDGRYVQLFDDRDLRQYSPLSASFEGPSSVYKGNTATWYSYVSGGNCGYTYEWKNNSTIVGYGSSISLTINYNFTLTLTVRSATGETRIVSDYITATTGSGGCPYVFAETEYGLAIDNNILHRSELKENRNKDIQDLYKLNILPTKIDNGYKLQIKELNRDHSFFDHFSLFAIDHSPDVSIGITEDNRIVSYKSEDFQIADEISFENGEILRGQWNRIKGTKGDVMHIKFSDTKLN